jgi:hypothetical protein
MIHRLVNQIFIIIFSLTAIGFSQVNPITGQAAYSLSLLPGIVLQYSGDMALKANTRNDQKKIGTKGLG